MAPTGRSSYSNWDDQESFLHPFLISNSPTDSNPSSRYRLGEVTTRKSSVLEAATHVMPSSCKLLLSLSADVPTAIPPPYLLSCLHCRVLASSSSGGCGMLVGCPANSQYLCECLCSGGAHRRRIILITLLDTPPGIWTSAGSYSATRTQAPTGLKWNLCIGPI